MKQHVEAMLSFHEKGIPTLDYGNNIRQMARDEGCQNAFADQKVKELIPDDKHLHNWLDMADQRISFQGLPARICWVGLGQRYKLGLAFNETVRKGELKAPVVIGRDHLGRWRVRIGRPRR